MIESGSISDCSEFIHDTYLGNGSHIFAIDSPDFPVSVRSGVISSGLSARQIADISYEFASTQREVLGKIIPVLPEDLDARLIYLPISEVSAFSVTQGGRYIVVVTAGIYDLLRTHSVNSILANRIESLVHKTKKTIPEAQKMMRILNLCTVLFVTKKLSGLLLTEDYACQNIIEAGWRIAEVSLLFVILHEFGHAHYAKLSDEQKELFSNDIQLHVNEELTKTKIEEFYADRFALSCLNPELSGPFIYASLVFFVIRAFIEAAGAVRGESHPLAVNRIWFLLRNCQLNADSYDNWASKILRQIDIIDSFKKDFEQLFGTSAVSALDELAVYAPLQIKKNKNEWLKIIKELGEMG